VRQRGTAAATKSTFCDVTDTDWVPLSRRAAGLPAEPLVDGVPDWLYPRLQEWLYHVLQHTDKPVMVLRPGHGYSTETREVMLRVQITTQPWLLPADDPRFLDAIDATLRWIEWSWPWPEGEDPGNLERLLAAANSVWRVSADGSGLERRVDETVTAAVTTTVRDAGTEAGGHLASAWAAAYADTRTPTRRMTRRCSPSRRLPARWSARPAPAAPSAL
jgi:hypothetical protein